MGTNAVNGTGGVNYSAEVRELRQTADNLADVNLYDGKDIGTLDNLFDIDDLSDVVADAEAAAEKLEKEGNVTMDDIDRLNSELERLINEINQAIEELEIKQDQLERGEATLEEDQRYYDELQNKYKEKANDYASIEDAIEKATEGLEESLKKNQQSAIHQAMADYNEEKDGDWKAFLSERLKGVVPDSKLQNMLTGLSSDKSAVATEMGIMQVKISKQQRVVENSQENVKKLEQQVGSLKTLIATDQASINTVRGKIVEAIMSSICEAEKALIEENNIDLNEKYPNGNPKYVFAKGKSDGQYHIYEMSEDGTSGTTLARTYGAGGGFDIVASGNGYMNGCKKLGDGEKGEGAEKIYYFNDCGGACSYDACYGTSSPLSFDIDGNGVDISNNIIEYDIDGDGIMDKIYDSADAVLVFDKDGDGVSGADGSECFGDNTDIDNKEGKDGYKNGFEALKALAMEAGVVDGVNDNIIDADDIKFLEDNYGFKIKTGGYNSEAVSLLDIGITEINLGSDDGISLEENKDGQGNHIMHQDGATFKMGDDIREYADIWHKKVEE